MQLILEVGSDIFFLRCLPDRAPATFARLLPILPQRVDLHCPKIAGSHIYWGAPFVADLEAAQDVMQMPAGAFFFWPERQMLEVAWAPLQSETAAVTFLGTCEGDLAALRRIGERVAREQGVRPTFAVLRAIETHAAEPMFAAPDGLATVRARRDALWAGCPGEIATLLASRAIMHPAGPLFFAEAEARGLHEILWWHYRRWRSEQEPSWREAAALSLAKAATRLGGFCHLHEAAATLGLAREALIDPLLDGDAAFEEAILIAGRLANWLDLRMPWSAINEAVRTALEPTA